MPDPTIECLGLIAGKGKLPESIIEHCQATGIPLCVIGLEKITDHKILTHVPHLILPFGAIGKAIKYLRSHNTSHLVFAGGVDRPSLFAIKPDFTGTKLLASLSLKKLAGDNSLLSHIVDFFEDKGFHILGADEILQDVLMPAGALTKTTPNKAALADIELATNALNTLGTLDIGQGVVVQQGTIIGVEAIEGTDELIKRCATLKLPGPAPILVKRKKPTQDTRIDLPTIGLNTLTQLTQAGFAGVAVEANSTILLEKKTCIDYANEHGVFLMGCG